MSTRMLRYSGYFALFILLWPRHDHFSSWGLRRVDFLVSLPRWIQHVSRSIEKKINGNLPKHWWIQNVVIESFPCDHGSHLNRQQLVPNFLSLFWKIAHFSAVRISFPISTKIACYQFLCGLSRPKHTGLWLTDRSQNDGHPTIDNTCILLY